MRWLRWLRAALWNVRGRRARELELDEELESYVSLLAQEELLRGRSGVEARRMARVAVGGVEQVKEEVRAVRAGAHLETVIRDVRQGVRGLIREKAFTVVAVVALGLGIGATAAIFSVVDGVLLRPLRYADPDRLVVVLHDGINPVSPANYVDWRRATAEFMELGAAEYWTPNVSGRERAEKVRGLRVVPELFPMLGVLPMLGRHFGVETGDPGRDREVVLSAGLWRRWYGADTAVVGRTLVMNGEPYTVVGVMPAGFRFAPFWATDSELWVPLAFAERTSSRSGNSLRVFGRLGPNVTLGAARERMTAITDALEAAYPGTNRNVIVTPLKEQVVGGARLPLLVLLSAVAFLLLIACANVAHMMLARAASRHREIVLRSALGASRGRLVRQLLTESVTLSLAGGAVGVIVAFWGVRLLRGLAGASVPRMDAVAVDARVLAFTFAVSLLTGVLFGVAPAWQASRRAPADVLREGDRGATHGGRRSRIRDVLIISEFALALVLLAGAGLMVRSFLALRHIDPGFAPDRVLSMQLSVNGAAAASPGARLVFYREVVARARTLPGVEAASAINHLPLAGDLWGLGFAVEGRDPPAPGERPNATYRVVMPGYFDAMGIALRRGRSFDDRDDVNAPAVVVINEAMAASHWPGEDPLGRRITFDDPAASATWLTIVGVVENAVRSDWAEPPAEELYVALYQNRAMLEGMGAHVAYVTLVVRAVGDAAVLAPAVRNLVNELDPNVAVSNVRTMTDVVAAAIAPSRFSLVLLAVFAGVALVLAVVGIFGMTSYAVSKRTHEIGIRMALGAEPLAVLSGVVRHGLILAAAGVVFGLGGAVLLTRLMASMLFGVAPTDPATYLLVSALLVAVALAGSAVPAWRVLRSDPLSALRIP
jgi:putative ABC transport system permease protein